MDCFISPMGGCPILSMSNATAATGKRGMSPNSHSDVMYEMQVSDLDARPSVVV